MNHPQGQDPADSMLASYTPDMADAIDTLEDEMRERLAKLGDMNKTVNLDRLAKEMASIIEAKIKTEGNTPTIKHKRDDTLDEAILAVVENRSPESLTSIAKKYINPNTGKPYTRAALCARLSEFRKRTGLFFRVQRSDRVKEIYRERAKRVHARRREECPKWNVDAWNKGLKKRCK